MGPRLIRLFAAAAVCATLGVDLPCRGQEAPAATPKIISTPGPNEQPEDWERLRSMSREDRIKAHQERVRQLVEETKKRQEEEARKKAEAQQGTPTPAAPAPPGQPVQPGQPLPAGPVQPVQATPAPAATPPPQQASAPEAARNLSRSLLFLRPFDSVVKVGETFETGVAADTQEGAADRITVLLRYPRTRLNPLAVDFSPILDSVEGDIECLVDEEQGELFFRIPLAEARELKASEIARITWEAIAATEGSDIKFAFGEDRTTAMYLDGEQVLGTPGGAGDGAIDGTVVIRERGRSKPVVQRVGSSGLVVSSGEQVAPPASMSLRLRPQKTAVTEGTQSFVDVVLENPNKSPFDRVQLYLQFDPDAMEVVDVDSGNWIRQGVNVSDGFAHDNFPFDYHKANEADNTRGNIVYDVGSELTPLRSDGTLVRIYFRALKPIDRTDVVLVVNEPGLAPTTDVTYRQTTMLRRRPMELAPLEGVALSIQPMSESLKRVARELRPELKQDEVFRSRTLLSR